MPPLHRQFCSGSRSTRSSRSSHMLVILVVLITHAYSSSFSQPWHHHSHSLSIIITHNIYLIQRDLLIFTYLLTPAHSLHLYILYTYIVSMSTQCQYLHSVNTIQCQCLHSVNATQCQCHTVSMPHSVNTYTVLMPHSVNTTQC